MIDDPVLDPKLIRSACANGNKAAVEELSNILVNNIHLRDTRTKSGSTHLVMRGEFLSDSLIGNFAYRMLRACNQTDLPPPKVLVDLMQLLLDQSRPPAKSERRYVQRLEAINYLKDNPKAGIREIARAVRVSPSTISRWKAAGKL